MKRYVSVLLAGTALCASAAGAPAFAQPATAQLAGGATSAVAEANPDAGSILDTVVVTARRRAEDVQDVPQTVQAISGDALQELSLFQFDDLSKVIPGVTLNRNGTSATIRGVSFNPIAQTNPTVAFYLNDSPVQPTIVFQSMVDVGQIEVLKGPQGTLRGQSAPSGAITITTRRPDMTRYGGYASATVTDQDGRNIQGAVNLPIVEGKLALRIAGAADHTNNGGVSSVNSTTQPELETDVWRATAAFQPTDDFHAVLIYQDLRTNTVSFGSAVVGNGAPGGTIKNAGYALPFVQTPGYNGPVISIGDRLAVAQNADRAKNHQQVANFLFDYDFADQRLSYVGGWSKVGGPPASNFADVPNMVLGDWPSRNLSSNLKRWNHELRLASQQPIGGLVDYVVGVFYQKEDIENDVFNGYSFQPGAFGTPAGAPLPQAPNLAYSTATLSNSTSEAKELSFFGNVNVHLGEHTELSGGIRAITAKKDAVRINSQTSGMAARVLTAAACTAAGGTLGATYAGVCDVPIAGRVTGTIPDKYTKKPVVYSASLSHHFTDDLLGYVSYGTSWRPGPTQGAFINGANDPVLTELTNLKDEKSRSFEVGLKTTWLNDRLNVNIAYYHQKYDNLVYSILSPVYYLADTGVSAPFVNVQIPTNVNVDAKVDGIDFDFNYAVMENWSIAGGLSWANGRFANSLIPCQDGNFDGRPDTITPTVAGFQAAGVHVAQCNISGSANALPKWNATLRTEYTHPIANGVEGFVSGLLTYYPKNPNASPGFVVDNYGLINLYLGARDPQAGWEVQVFAKNITNNDTVTSFTSNQITTVNSVAGFFGNSGYSNISYQLPREFGVTFRYALGSR